MNKSYLIGFIGSLFSSVCLLGFLTYLNVSGNMTDKHILFGLIGWTIASEARTRGSLRELKDNQNQD